MRLLSTDLRCRYLLGLWRDAHDPQDEPRAQEAFAREDDARSRAAQLVAGPRFRYVSLFRWNPAKGDWDEIDTFDGDETDADDFASCAMAPWLDAPFGDLDETECDDLVDAVQGLLEDA